MAWPDSDVDNKAKAMTLTMKTNSLGHSMLLLLLLQLLLPWLLVLPSLPQLKHQPRPRPHAMAIRRRYSHTIKKHAFWWGHLASSGSHGIEHKAPRHLHGKNMLS